MLKEPVIYQTFHCSWAAAPCAWDYFVHIQTLAAFCTWEQGHFQTRPPSVYYQGSLMPSLTLNTWVSSCLCILFSLSVSSIAHVESPDSAGQSIQLGMLQTLPLGVPRLCTTHMSFCTVFRQLGVWEQRWQGRCMTGNQQQLAQACS